MLFIFACSGNPSLPSFLRKRSNSRTTTATKRSKPESVKTWTRSIICLPKDYQGKEGQTIQIPRKRKRAILGQCGLIGKILLKSTMTEEDIKSEVRSVFSQAMGHDPLFPFRFLQATGSGTKTLTVPGVSTHFHWTSSEVAGLGSSIYVIADQDLVVPVSTFMWYYGCHYWGLACTTYTMLALEQYGFQT